MRKLNLLLVILIVGVLLFPGVVVAKIAEACCGVIPQDLVVEDSPDPACVSQDVTISGTYTVVPDWDPWQAYDTGVLLTILDPDGGTVFSGSLTLATAEPDAPKDFEFEYTFHIDMEGTYTYTVQAWATTSYGTETTDVVAGEIEAEECCVAPALERVIRDRLATECDPEAEYANHGAYISCAAQIIDEYLEAGDITEEEASCFMNPIARSKVGMPSKSNKPGNK